MIEAAFKALSQMTSPPFRAVLLKSVGLALLILLAAAFGLHRLFSWLAESGGAWLEGSLGLGATIVAVLLWIFAIIAGIGLFAGAIFLMPAVTALVASFFADEIAEHVERTHYPAEPVGFAMPIARAVLEGARTALLALGIYLVAAPFLLFAGLGLLIFFFANAYLLGREYFLMAAMRYHAPAEARALRREHRNALFIAGMLIAVFVSIPIVNLATPLFGTAFMVHLHKRLTGGRRIDLIEPRSRSIKA